MLSTPWSLGFVLAVILGAMLVPGCRPQDGPSRFGSSKVTPNQYHRGNQGDFCWAVSGGGSGGQVRDPTCRTMSNRISLSAATLSWYSFPPLGTRR